MSELAKKYKWFDWLETKYYNITIGIFNIFQWLPIIWHDRDWEYEDFTEKFIYHKLKRLQKRPYGTVFGDGDWMTRYINLCIWLFEEKWKMENLEDDLWKSIEPGESVFGDPDDKGLIEWNVVWSSPDAAKKYHEVEELRYRREKKIHHLIYHILETRGQGWWD